MSRINSIYKLLMTTVPRLRRRPDEPVDCPYVSQCHEAFALQVAGHYEGALAQWQALFDAEYRPPLVYCGLVGCAVALERVDLAMETVKAGLQLFSLHEGIAAEAAQIEERWGTREASVQHWSVATSSANAHPTWHVRHIASLHFLRRYDEAKEMLAEALDRFPNDAVVAAEAGQDAERAGDWQRGIAHWEKAASARDAHPVWRQKHVYNLIVLGCYDEASALLDACLAEFPDHAGFSGLEGILALQRNDIDRSLALWKVHRRRFPDDVMGWEHYGRAYQAKQIALMEEGHQMPHSVPATIERLHDLGSEELLMRFQSLGYSCEFGLVQRRFGAEPLGLLRFSSVDFGGLLSAAAARFEGIGDAEFTEIVVSHGEYIVRDKRWGFSTHTFVTEWQERSDVITNKLLQRTSFLKRKLIDDLQAGEKICVYIAPGLSLDDLILLRKALGSIGPAPLLYVAFADSLGEGIEPLAPGCVTRVGEGLYLGHLRREGRTQQGVWDVDFNQWLNICKNAYSLASVETTTSAISGAEDASPLRLSSSE